MYPTSPCRYAQEMAGEGWAGMRARLITLHARFYGAVLLVLLLSIVFYSRCATLVAAVEYLAQYLDMN